MSFLCYNGNVRSNVGMRRETEIPVVIVGGVRMCCVSLIHLSLPLV